MSETIPSIESPRIVAAYEAPDGSVWIHNDLSRYVEPFSLTEKFGDLESWASYTKGHAGAGDLLTWDEHGFIAKLDYQTARTAAGRWQASYPFVATPQWKDWQAFATGHGVPHKAAVEFLEDHAPDIIEPDAASLLAILRSLRANVTSNASTELRPDGTTHVAFARDQRVAAGNPAAEVDLPPQFEIGVPVLRGDGQVWKLVVRVRVSVTPDTKMELRFSMPQAETVLETVYAERVAAAAALLGAGFTVLRAAS